MNITETAKAPKPGQKVTVHSFVGGSCTDTPDGQIATYEGTVNGSWEFQGSTSDRYFVTAGTAWTARD